MNSFLEVVLRTVLISLAIAGTATLARKFLPASRVDPSAPDLSIDSLEARFLALKWRVITSMILIGLGLGMVIYFALTSANRALAGTAQYRFFPAQAIWWFLPGFASICLCWELTLQFWSLSAGRRFVQLFSDWTNNSTEFWGGGRYAGIDSRKVLRWMFLLIVSPIGVFTVLALNMHTEMTSDGIRECGYAFKSCAVHPYTTIRRMTWIAGHENNKGKFIAEPAIVLEYSDGKRWSSANWSGLQKTLDPGLLTFLADKTHLNLERHATEADIPPLGK